MQNNIVGRKKEIKILAEALSSNAAEFIAVYGRRRVGKTYLVKQYAPAHSDIFFELTGIYKSNIKTQLNNFSTSLSKAFYENADMAVQKTWLACLNQLTMAIDKVPNDKIITLFFDELPWLSSPKSGFLGALEYYWNTSWSFKSNIKLIVCGSAASWMLKKLIYAKGGLHNRITVSMLLEPFTLKESSDYLAYNGHRFNHDQVLQIYMIMGGIPHYLKNIKKNLSITQNIDALCFQKGGLLFEEFNKLFNSLYSEPEIFIKIIRVIATITNGISREELIKLVKNVSNGGHLNDQLQNLEDAGFISKFVSLGHIRRGVHYKLIDEYALFYLNWIEPLSKKTRITTTTSYWPTVIHKSAWYVWAGYAFEAVCSKHMDQIKKAIGLDKIHANWGDWRYISKDGSQGAQIDLVLDRDDDCVTLCEIKFTEKEFVIKKSYAKDIQTKEVTYKQQTRTKKQIQWCLITNNGAAKNEYFNNLISHVTTVDDLFIG